MIVLNYKDGSSQKFNLNVEAERKQLNEVGLGESKRVSGIWLIKEDKQKTTLPMPDRYRRVFFYVEVLSKGEEVMGYQLTIQTEETRLVTKVYTKGGMITVTMTKTGRQIYIPKGLI